jgi:hypothetical protein
MGLLGKLFGGEPEFPPLEPESPAAAALRRDGDLLVDLAARANDRLEIVPGARTTVVLVGKPPKAFGVVWLEDGREHNVKALVKERGLSPAQVERLIDELREAYLRSTTAPRRTWAIGDKTVVVTPSELLAQEVTSAIQRFTA